MTIRIGGMASGMDIDQLVSDLMKAERIPVDKKSQKKKLVEYRMDLYREVNSKLMTLRDNINKMRFGADFSATKATSSNENAVKVSGNNPSKVSTTIEVVALAKQAFKNSTESVTNGGGLDLSKSLEDNAGQFKTTPTLEDSMTMTINGVDISYSKTDTVQGIINKVNQSSAGVALSYDSSADQFVFISKQTGEAAEIDVKDTSGSFLSSIKMDSAVKNGEDAKVVINGIESKRSSNTFTQDGVTYNLLQTTSAPVTINNATNTEDMVAKVKEFVALYNDAMSLVNKLTKESKMKGYDPLTSEQKSAMSEDEIKNWEILVKKGLLRNDTLLEPFARNMRSSLSQFFNFSDGTKLSAMDIGLGTAAFNKNAADFSAEAGKIVLDEKKLREAIEANPGKVETIFTSTNVTGGQEGLFQQMYKRLNTTISDITKKSGAVGGSYNDVTSELGKQSGKIELEIKTLEDRLIRKENNYYKQFAAMEKAMANSNSQLNFLMQNLG